MAACLATARSRLKPVADQIHNADEEIRLGDLCVVRRTPAQTARTVTPLTIRVIKLEAERRNVTLERVLQKGVFKRGQTFGLRRQRPQLCEFRVDLDRPGGRAEVAFRRRDGGVSQGFHRPGVRFRRTLGVHVFASRG